MSEMFYKNKVSIIVPAYNVEDYLERCIESILEQSYENLEIIIVNDGSTDYTGIIGKQYSTKFPEKIQYYEINHRGPGAARNAGIQYATGEYIGFVDADDDIHKNMYKEMVACAKEKSADIVICNIKFYDLEKGKEIIQKSINYGELNKNNYMRYGINLCSSCNKIFKKRIFEKYKFENITYEDSELIPVIISYANKVEFIEKHFYHYYYRIGSTSNCVKDFKIEDFFYAIINSINKVNPEYRKELTYWHARAILNSMYGNKKTYYKSFCQFVEENKALFEDNILIKEDYYVNNILKLGEIKDFEKVIKYDFTLLGESERINEILDKQPESELKCKIQILELDSEGTMPWERIKGRFFTIVDRKIQVEEDFFEKLCLYSKVYGNNCSMIAVPIKSILEKNKIININKNYKSFIPEDYLIFYNTNILCEDMTFPINISYDNCFTYAVLKHPNIYLPANISVYCENKVFPYEDLYQWGRKEVVDKVLSDLKISMSVAMGIPVSIQYYSMLKLKSVIEMEYFNGITKDEVFKEFKDMIVESIKYIDDQVLMTLPRTTPEHRVYMFRLKYGSEAELNSNNGKLELVYNGKSVYCQDDTYTLFEFIDYETDELILEGRTICLNAVEDEEVIFYAVANGNIYPAEILKRECSRYSLGDIIFKGMEFRVKIPIKLKLEWYTIKFFYLYRGFKIARNDIRFAKYAPLTKKFKYSYYKVEDRVLTFEGNQLLFRPCGRKGKLIHERDFLKEIKEALGKEEYKEVKKLRILAMLYNYFFKKKEKIWLISDKAHRGDDNGEAFFKYLNSTSNLKRKIKSYYIIDKNISDFKRIKKIGKTVHFNSFKHKLLSLLCQYQFAAYVHVSIVCPLASQREYFKDFLKEDKVVFFQHGITQNNLSSALHKYNQNFHAIVAANIEERNSFLRYDYFYDEKLIKLLGFPRYDYLYDDNRKYITFAPTWRRYLFGDFVQEEERYVLKRDFKQSSYYQFYNAVVNSPKLIEAVKEYGYELHFIPHPVFFPYLEEFQFNENVVVHGKEVSYNTMFAQSSLFITDYSSAVFDFAYLEKPIIYTQFDTKEFYSMQYEKGNFDYVLSGFGEVVQTVDETIELIISYIENHCAMEEKYKKRVNNFFAFHDHHNCERIFEEFYQ